MRNTRIKEGPIKYSQEITNTDLNLYQGLIIASDWDATGSVIAVKLQTKYEQEFPLIINKNSETLVNYCKNEVLIKGYVNTEGFLYVSLFKVLLK